MPPKKKTHEVTLALEAGNAAMVDLGKMLGPTGANMRAVKLEYDEATSCPHDARWLDVVDMMLADRELARCRPTRR